MNSTLASNISHKWISFNLYLLLRITTWVGNHIMVLLPSWNFNKVRLIPNHDIWRGFIPPTLQQSTGVENFSCFYVCYEYLRFVLFKCLRIIGNHPRRNPTSHLHISLNIEPFPLPIHRLNRKFFAHCPLNQKPLIWNYSLDDLINLYKKI